MPEWPRHPLPLLHQLSLPVVERARAEGSWDLRGVHLGGWPLARFRPREHLLLAGRELDFRRDREGSLRVRLPRWQGYLLLLSSDRLFYEARLVNHPRRWHPLEQELRAARILRERQIGWRRWRELLPDLLAHLEEALPR